jgi:TDG/mug DNA glycosylase family protein
MTLPRRPTAAELQAAAGKRVPDVIGPGLNVLLCGINPGLYSAAIGHHFGRPGNRFWPALYGGGFTPRLYSPYEDQDLLPLGIGITNVVERASAGESDLTRAELAAGGEILRTKVGRYRPRCLAVLGVGAYRSAFGRPKAVLGRQPEGVGRTMVWVLPNPSGLNAHYGPAELARLFGELRQAVAGISSD